MEKVEANREWVAMRNNVSRVVHSLELCWKCQKVSECQKYVLGQTVLVWLCKSCLTEMEARQPDPPRNSKRSATRNTTGLRENS